MEEPTQREKLATFFSTIRNLDCYSTASAINYFCRFREYMINELNFTEQEMHDAYMKFHRYYKDEKG